MQRRASLTHDGTQDPAYSRRKLFTLGPRCWWAEPDQTPPPPEGGGGAKGGGQVEPGGCVCHYRKSQMKENASPGEKRHFLSSAAAPGSKHTSAALFLHLPCEPRRHGNVQHASPAAVKPGTFPNLSRNVEASPGAASVAAGRSGCCAGPADKSRVGS